MTKRKNSEHGWLKLKHIYLPFIVIISLFVIGYTFLNWALVIETEWLPVKENVANIWLPLLLSWIPVVIWLRPRIKLLKLDANDNKPLLYSMFAVVAIALPTIIAQHYVAKASGELKKFYSIEQISQRNPSKYYKFRQYYIDKKYVGVYPTFEVSGKYNEDLIMQIYVAAPILVKESDTIYGSCLGWLGFEYKKTVSNRLDDNEKDTEFRVFADKCQADFEKNDIKKFVYIERVRDNSEEAEAYQTALRNSPKSHLGPLRKLVFLPVYEPFENRTGNKLLWFVITLSIGFIGWLIMVLVPKFNESAFKRFKSGLGSEDEEDILERFLVPKGNWFITPILAYLNILVFLAMVLAGLGVISLNAEDLLVWGGNFRPVTMDGEWWRLFTNLFLHGGIIHLAGNLYGLILVGIFLEPVMGKAKFLISYLITGILASCASIWWHEATVSVGASGAIFGMFGIFLAMLLRKVFTGALSRFLMINTLIFLGYNLVMGLNDGIDNAAHIGGLLAGFAIGFILNPVIKKATGNEFMESMQPEEDTNKDSDGIMTRADYVAICKTCKHKELNSEVGIICGFTKRIADFDKECSEYIRF